MRLTADIATRFTTIALGHVARAYPHKLDHVWLSDTDGTTPRAQHPIFFGSFDWHSCVHGYWTLARCLRRFPDRTECAALRSQFDVAFTPENVAAECAYLARPHSRVFERPYGWAWLLKLAAELKQFDDADGQRWSATLQPLADAFVARFLAYLPLATYPVRAGAHTNTAFATALALDYCDAFGAEDLRVLLTDSARRWYALDQDCQAWEPSQDEFLSSALMEAEAMRRVLAPSDFRAWFAAFLPNVATRRPATLFTPVTVSDRTDGKIAHLDGLNLSRAWCWRGIAAALAQNDPARVVAIDTADIHLQSALPHVAGDYMGEHWLASFALLALEV
ncbi:MAG: DUF2891 domain-containing protein [Alphaproteobacteria bacterium]|nr:DUF2891 domain-containing protein [Alphaproteobacteria bacterium]